MGVFDQAAGFATQTEPEPVIGRLLRPTGLTRRFQGWFPTKAIPLPGGPDRTADLVAILEAAEGAADPALLVLELQGQHDPEKLDNTLLEAAIFRTHARHGADGREKYKVWTGLVYLRGRCPEPVLDLTLPGGFGTRHAPLLWQVADDNAETALQEVEEGRASWGLLFWVSLMTGAEKPAIIERWMELVAAKVADPWMRGNLAGIALVFAELAGCYLAWERALEGWQMTESQVVNRWMARGELNRARGYLVQALRIRFPESTTEEVVQMVQQQQSLARLDEWFAAALRATTFEQFRQALRGNGS